ncbi:MAG: MFS transporter [Christensenellales bacterium]
MSWGRRFAIIWTGRSLSLFTSSIAQMSLIWHLTERTGSAAVLSLLMLVAFLPQALLGPFIGAWVDRYDRKRIMILSDAAIALVTSLLVLVGLAGEIPLWLIMTAAVLRSIGSAFYDPSLQAVTPLIVPRDSLARCAGYSQTFESFSLLLSPAVSALLYGLLRLPVLLSLDAAGALIGILSLLAVRIPSPEKAAQAARPSMLRETREGLLVLRGERGLPTLLLVGALYAVIFMPIGTLYPLISMTYFRGTFRESSLVEVAFAAGTLIGSLLLSLRGDRLNKVGAITWSIAGMGLGLAATGLLPPGAILVFTALAAFMGFTTPFYWGMQTALFQSRIQPEYLGRVLSLSTSVQMVAMPLGLILSGAFAQEIGVEKWFLISGILSLALALFCRLHPALRAGDKLSGPPGV